MKKITLGSIYFSNIFMSFYFLIVLLSDCYLQFNSTINKMVLVLGAIISIFTIAVYILERKTTKWGIVLILYGIYGALSSYLGNYSNIYNFFTSYIKIAGISLYMDMSLKNKTLKTLKNLNSIYFFLLIINFISIIMYPNGLYKDALYSSNWFFLYDNMHILMFLPALLVNCLICYYKEKICFSTIIEFLIVTYCVFYCFSANSVVAYCIFILYLLFNKKISKMEILNSKNYFKTYIVTFLSLVAFKIQEIFRWFIIEILGKDMTFSSRTILWERVIHYIKEKPLIGYGAESTRIFSEKMGSANFTHAHNSILNVSYKYGLIGFIFYILLILIPTKKLYKYKDTKASKIISVVLFCILIMCIFEAREEKIGYYIVLVLGANISNIVECYGNKKRDELC